MSFFKKLKGGFQAPKATVSVTLDKRAFDRQEPITGTLHVTSSEEFESDEIRIELEVTEWTKATETPGSTADGKIIEATVTAQQTVQLYREKTAITERMKITKGFKRDYPFSLPVPLGVPSTYHGRNATNKWMMKGVIAVKGRPDVTSHPTEVIINP